MLLSKTALQPLDTSSLAGEPVDLALVAQGMAMSQGTVMSAQPSTYLAVGITVGIGADALPLLLLIRWMMREVDAVLVHHIAVGVAHGHH